MARIDIFAVKENHNVVNFWSFGCLQRMLVSTNGLGHVASFPVVNEDDDEYPIFDLY